MEPEEIALEVYLALLVLVSALFRAFRIFLSVTQHPMFSTGKSMGPAAEVFNGAASKSNCKDWEVVSNYKCYKYIYIIYIYYIYYIYYIIYI